MSFGLDKLEPAWVGWVANRLFEGTSIADVAVELSEEGLELEQAESVVRQVAESPVFLGLRSTLEAVHLRRAFLRTATEVPRLSMLALYRHGFASAQTPVLVEGLTRGWPALQWTWAGLVERVGEVELEVSVERDRPDGHIPSLRTTEQMPFASLVERLLNPATGNLCYVTASDAAKARLTDLHCDLPDLPIATTNGGMAFWIGAAGAYTPLHRDLSTTLIAPVIGRKRVVLVPPEALLATRQHRYWAVEVDLDDPDLFARTVEVGPGDALSIPGGWWHAVTTLEPCFMVTLANLVGLKNRFDQILAPETP